MPGSSSGSSGPSLGSLSGAVATSTQGVQRSAESPVTPLRGKSSSSSLEQKPTPLRSKSTLASSKKRSKRRSQEAKEPEGQKLQLVGEEAAVEPSEGQEIGAVEGPSTELFSSATLPEGSRPVAQEAAAERRDSDERRRSSSLFSDAGDQKRVSDSSTFSIPAGRPPRKSRTSTSPGSDSHLPRRSSSLFNEMYGLPGLSDLDAFQGIPQPDEPWRKSSSIGSASLFSANSRPSHEQQSDRRSSSSLFSAQGYQSYRRSSSLFSVQMSGDEGGEGRPGAPEPALAKTSALSTQAAEQSPATPATNDDANITVVPAVGKRKQQVSPGASPPHAKQTKRSTISSSSLKQSEPLFITPSVPAPAAGRTSSEAKTSSSSLAQSTSLFSSPERPMGDQESSKSNSTDSSLVAEILLRKTSVPREEKGKKYLTYFFQRINVYSLV